MYSNSFQIREEVFNKCDITSKLLREDGNGFFKQKKIFDAIYCFNQAAVFAESKINLALAYGNRSAAYFEAKLYAECIKSIKFAREADYPEEKIDKLIAREQKCMKLMAEQGEEDPADDLWNYLKLSYTANKKLPWMVKGLAVRRTEKFGRGIYAQQNYKPGDIICIEDMKIHMVDFNGFFRCCNNCSKTCMMNLIPCDKTASFMFCSIECRDEFHKYEDFSSGAFDKTVFLMKKIEAAFGDLESVSSYLNEHSTQTIFDFDFSNPNDPNYWINYYKCFLAAKGCAMGYEYLTKDCFNLMTKKLLYHIAGIMIRSSIIAHQIKHENATYRDHKEANVRQVFFESGKLSFSTFNALLNHSCIANVDYFCIENKVIFYITKPIKTNDQIFVNYTREYYEQGEVRRNVLLKDLGVDDCGCLACINKLTMAHLRIENPDLLVALTENETLSETVCCVENSMSRVRALFEVLKQFTSSTSVEHFVAIKAIQVIYRILADRLMFPA